MKIENLLEIIIKINKKYFPKLRYSKENLWKIAEILNSHIIDEEMENIEEMIIKYFKASILKSIPQNTFLQKIYFTPYKEIYDTINEMFQITPTKKTFLTFIEIVLDAERKFISKFSIKDEIYIIYQKELKKNIEKKEPVKQNTQNTLLKIIQKEFSVSISLHALLTALERLKQENQNYYTVIILKHGKDLSEMNPLGRGQELFYTSAIQKLKEIIQNILIEEKTKFEKKNELEMNLKKEKNLKPQKETLLNRIKSYEHLDDCTLKDLKDILEILKENNIDYYQIIIKKHGKSLKENNILSEQENEIYQIALKELRKILVEKQQEKETILQELTMVKEKYFEELQYTKEDLWKIAKTLNLQKKEQQENKEEIIKEYFKTSILKSISRNTHLQNIYFTPYKEVYDTINEMFFITPTSKTFLSFITIVLNTDRKKTDLIETIYMSYHKEIRKTKEKKNSQNTLLKIIQKEYPKVSKKELLIALEILKQENQNCYTVIILKHGEDLSETNPLGKGQELFYTSAIQKLKEIIKRVLLEEPKKFEIEKKEEKTLSMKEKEENKNLTNPSPQERNRKQEKQKENLLTRIKSYEGFENCSLKELKESLEILKENNIEYYKIIIKKHGESLKENNVLTTKENEIYQIALKELRKILIEKRKESNFTLLERIRNEKELNDCTEEELRTALNLLPTSYYTIIIKKNGESLCESNKLSPKENNTYSNAIRKLKYIILEKRKEKENILQELINIKETYFQELPIEPEKLLKELSPSSITKNSILKAIKTYISKYEELQALLFSPFKEIYDKTNEMLQVTPNKETYQMFIETILNVQTLDYSKNNVELQKEEIYSTYQRILKKTIPTQVVQKKETTPIVEKKIKESPKPQKRSKTKTSLFDIIKSYKGLEHFTNEKILSVVEKLQTTNPNYYEIIIKRHGESLLEENNISKQEYIVYRKAIQKIKQLLKPKKNKRPKVSLFDLIKSYEGYENFTDEQILIVVKRLQTTNPNYYEIIIKKHGESLLEQNSLSKQEQKLYWNAILKIKKELITPTVEKKVSLFEKIKSYKGFEHFTNEEILNVVEKLQTTNPNHYKIIIKKHGKSLLEDNDLLQEEKIIYNEAIKNIKNELKRSKVPLFDIIKSYKEFENFTNEEISCVVEMLQPTNQNYYEIIIKRHGESLLEEHNISKQEYIVYRKAIQKIKQLLKQKKKKISLFDRIRNYKGFEHFTNEQILKVVQKLQITNPNYYEIILKKHGESLLDDNDLLQEEKIIYNKAMKKIKKELKRPKVSLFDIIRKYKGFEHFTNEEIISVVEKLKNTNPNYYEVIKKRHGESFLEENNLSRQEYTIYYSAIKKVKKELITPSVEKKVSLFDIIRNYEGFEHFTNEQILKVVQKLQTTYPNYYEIIIKRHGESLLEKNNLSRQEYRIYYRAILKIKKELITPTVEKKVSLFDIIRDYKGFEHFTNEQILSVIEKLQTTNPNYYVVIIKKHGISLLENNSLLKKEYRIYKDAIKKVKKELKRPKVSLFDIIRNYERFEHFTNEQILNVIEKLQTTNPNYYVVIIKKHGISLLENNNLLKEEYRIYYNAILKIKKELRSLTVEKKVSFFNKIRNYKGFEHFTNEQILSIVEKLQTTNLNYYEVIIKKHGESLLEDNNLSKQEYILYRDAIKKVKKELITPSVEKKVSLFDKIKSYEGFEHFTNEQILSVVEKFKNTNPNYYEIILKKHGTSLLENNNLSKEEYILYQSAIKKIKKELKRPTIKVSLFESIRLHAKNKDYTDDEIKISLEFLNIKNKREYKSIISLSLIEENKLTNEEKITNKNAFSKLSKILSNTRKILQEITEINKKYFPNITISLNELKTLILKAQKSSNKNLKSKTILYFKMHILEEIKTNEMLKSVYFLPYEKIYNNINKLFHINPTIEDFDTFVLIVINKKILQEDSQDYNIYKTYYQKIEEKYKTQNRKKDIQKEELKKTKDNSAQVTLNNISPDILKNIELQQVLYYIEILGTNQAYSYKKTLEALQKALKEIKQNKKEYTTRKINRTPKITQILEDINTLEIKEISLKYDIPVRKICEITLENIFFFENIAQIINKIIQAKPCLEKTIYQYLGSFAFPYLKELNEKEKKYWHQEFERDIKRIRNIKE